MRRILLPLLLIACAPCQAQRLAITKIDPPNWFATLPRPMLLVHGEGFTGATFSISDKAIRIERTDVSANGHYAQLWLSHSPAAAETVQLSISHGSEHTQEPYAFAAPRPANEGMAGFSGADVMYLIVTDRFADGDLNNDGPEGKSPETSDAAATERGKLRGWHGGDLRGIEQHLDYLQSLGVTTIWPTPVYQNHAAEAFHGYHATDYYSVDEHYGSMADLQSLVKALHARGMKLVLDTVPNHVGPAHPWVQDSPTPDWFHGTAADHIAGETHFDALVNPHVPERDRVSTLKGWFVNSLPDMNTDNPVVAQYLRQNAVWWIEETGADGLRIDTFPYVDRPFWHAFHAELHELFPHLTEVGEVSGPDPMITAAFGEGSTRMGVDTGLYTPFDFPFYHAAQDVFVNNVPFTRISHLLAADGLYPHPERLVPFLGNHDESRFAEGVTDAALRGVAYTLLLTTRGTPQWYAGDELAQRGGNDPDNRHDFPGGFPGSSANGFVASGRNTEQARDFDAVKALLALRRTHPALQTGTEQILEADADTLIYVRSAPQGEQVLIALNKGGAAQTRTIQLDNTTLVTAAHVKMLLGSAAISINSHKLTVSFTSKEAVVAVIE